jgi:catechol 2,3-dioxygenase-like lactoylglutathione lyase family enzyme
MMLGYVTIGALDEAKAKTFYDAVFGAMGCDQKFSDGGWTGYGAKGQDNHDVYIVAKTADGNPARAGNGIMISFKAKTKGEVEAAHKAGLSHGGADEGAPGPRPADSTTFFGAYLRDPTGNKICVYCKPN